MISYSPFDFANTEDKVEVVVCESCFVVVPYARWTEHSNWHYALAPMFDPTWDDNSDQPSQVAYE